MFKTVAFKLVEWFKHKKNRTALYVFGVSALTVLSTYGLLTTEQQEAWVAVLVAGLGIGGTALSNLTPDKEKEDKD